MIYGVRTRYTANLILPGVERYWLSRAPYLATFFWMARAKFHTKIREPHRHGPRA